MYLVRLINNKISIKFCILVVYDYIIRRLGTFSFSMTSDTCPFVFDKYNFFFNEFNYFALREYLCLAARL